MARVIIYHQRARRESNKAAERFVRERLREIQFQARLHVVFGPYTTGNLARSIRTRGPFMDLGMVSGSVGSDLSYAAAVESGAGLWGPRHSKYLIRPVAWSGHLRFYWRKVGKVVTLPYVNHPGQRGKGYLHQAAQSVARRHRMLIIFRDV